MFHQTVARQVVHGAQPEVAGAVAVGAVGARKAAGAMAMGAELRVEQIVLGEGKAEAKAPELGSACPLHALLG